jgi:hypothetical protein
MKKDSPEGTKAKLQIEGRAPMAIAVVKFDPCQNIIQSCILKHLSLISDKTLQAWQETVTLRQNLPPYSHSRVNQGKERRMTLRYRFAQIDDLMK